MLGMKKTEAKKVVVTDKDAAIIASKGFQEAKKATPKAKAAILADPKQVEEILEGSGKVPFLRKVTPYDKGGKAGHIVYQFGNGKSIEFDIATVSEANKTRAMYHGLSQRTGDACSGFSKANDFAGAMEALQKVLDILPTQDWTITREGGGAGRQLLADLAEAIASIKGLKLEAVQQLIEAADEAKIKQWAKHPKIAFKIAELVLARKKAALGEDEDFSL